MIKKTPYIIAEIGLNHNGKFSIAKESIIKAAECGVDAVKFQNFITEDFIKNKNLTHTYYVGKKKITKSLYDICKKSEYRNEWTKKLINLCKKKNIDFLSTPTSTQGIDHLKKHNLKVIKNGSDYLVHLDLIEYMAKKKFQIILSTGMADKRDIDEALRVIKKNSTIKPILLHCVSQYPTENKYLNLRRITSLKKKYKLKIGFSDHSIGPQAACQAVALGAKVFEKHFTINKNLNGPDHSFSCNPEEMKIYVDSIKESILRMGSEEIKPSKIEKKFKDEVRLGCVININLKKNEKIKKEHVIYQKNSKGLLPSDLRKYLNKKLKLDLTRGSVLKKNYFKI
ncbi:N-acetylneuraminate synthase family protein [Candidatus Pelagibacter bacterium nBUS_36]|uniref:N-acetylneuraminate synthase family protein n=1 Tax=Candidatus Pelagibacter bacterium nBUS_36 TaxID=3374194 RepID=UPI003EBCDB2F